MTIQRAGYVALVGRPNVGKSTLLNTLLDMTLAITSPKPQTTRRVIRGVAERDQVQYVFLDTPGLHVPKDLLGQHMMRAAAQAIDDADVVVMLIEASFRPFLADTEKRLVKRLKTTGKPAILALNKVDRSEKERLLPLIDLYRQHYDFAAYVPVSARHGDGVEALLKEIAPLLPEQGRLYAVDDYTDETERQLAAELVRRELVFQLHEELPYGAAVAIETFTETENEQGGRRLRIEAAIVCARDSHKRMIVGKGGSGVRRIGERARIAIAQEFAAEVDLMLFVRVRKDWRDTAEQLKDLGLSR